MEKWYLINDRTKPNVIGGFENQGFLDNKDDAFLESLTTDIADDLVLYNYDLSTSTPFRGIIQGNTADTQLKSMERIVLVPIGFLHSGDYVYFEDEFWIVDGRPGNNKIYEKATLKECQYKIRWQKDDGEIVERWANLVSASKYDVGEEGNKVLVLTSNNFTITIPNDEDSQTIAEKRVFIDLQEYPEKVFKITRNDDILFNHNSHGGTLSLIADKVELNKEKDNQELRICDYIDPEELNKDQSSTNPEFNQSNVLSTILGHNTIKIGIPTEYEVTFHDENGDVDADDVNFEFRIDDNYKDIVEISYSDDRTKVSLLIYDEDYIDEIFTLQVFIDEKLNSELTITIDTMW